MKNFQTILILLLLESCFGCVLATAPRENVDFSRADDIQAFAGCYKNLGEGGAGALRYLSTVIWPEEKIIHSSINSIHVAVANAKTLIVTAQSQGRILRESLFVEGKDFHLNSGRIKVKSDPLVSFAYPPGNVFIGVGYESQEIGIDESGDGKLQEAGTFAGTAFLVIPVAGHVRDSFRFRRVKGLCSGS